MLATVTKLLAIVTVAVGCLVNVGDVTSGVDEFNFDVLIVTEVGRSVVRTGEGLVTRLGEGTSVVLLADTTIEDVLSTAELSTCDVEGISVTRDEDAVTPNDALIDGMVGALETNVKVDSLGCNATLELFLAVVVVGSNKLEMTADE